MRRQLFLWARMLVVDSLVLGFLYAWKLHGIDSAGNVFRFWIWFVCIVSTFTLWAEPEYRPDLRKGARFVVGVTFDFVLIGSMAWFGLTSMAIAYTTAALLGLSFRSRCLDLKPDAA